MTRELPNLAAAAFGILLSSAYIWQARAIEDSLLSDEVGAGGVPAGVGLLMLAASLGLLLKAVLVHARARRVQARTDASCAPAEAQDGPAHPHRMALGLLAILGGYVVLLPWAGYVVSMGLLAVAVARFAGARMGPALLAFAVSVGPLLWFLFQHLLQVRMPAGVWPALFGG